MALGARTLTIANGSTTYAGVIGGTGGLTLTAGTQTLTGANTYTGATTINAGTLALSGTGSVASSSQVNVANAAGTFSIFGHHRGRDDHDAEREFGDQSSAMAARTLTIANGSTTLCRRHRRHRRTDPDGGHRRP